MLLKLLHLTAFAPCLQAKPIWDSCFSSFLLALHNCVSTWILEHLALYLEVKRGEKLQVLQEKKYHWDNIYPGEVAGHRGFLGGTKTLSLRC